VLLWPGWAPARLLICALYLCIGRARKKARWGTASRLLNRFIARVFTGAHAQNLLLGVCNLAADCRGTRRGLSTVCTPGERNFGLSAEATPTIVSTVIPAIVWTTNPTFVDPAQAAVRRLATQWHLIFRATVEFSSPSQAPTRPIPSLRCPRRSAVPSVSCEPLRVSRHSFGASLTAARRSIAARGLLSCFRARMDLREGSGALHWNLFEALLFDVEKGLWRGVAWATL